ncbi:cytochrome c-type biogenesis protein [Actinacidiphila glaucinigra]
MESLGYLVGALIWGVPVATLVAGSLVAVLVVRWRRKAIGALERAEGDA